MIRVKTWQRRENFSLVIDMPESMMGGKREIERRVKMGKTEPKLPIRMSFRLKDEREMVEGERQKKKKAVN